MVFFKRKRLFILFHNEKITQHFLETLVFLQAESKTVPESDYLLYYEYTFCYQTDHYTLCKYPVYPIYYNGSNLPNSSRWLVNGTCHSAYQIEGTLIHRLLGISERESMYIEQLFDEFLKNTPHF